MKGINFYSWAQERKFWNLDVERKNRNTYYPNSIVELVAIGFRRIYEFGVVRNKKRIVDDVLKEQKVIEDCNLQRTSAVVFQI